MEIGSQEVIYIQLANKMMISTNRWLRISGGHGSRRPSGVEKKFSLSDGVWPINGFHIFIHKKC